MEARQLGGLVVLYPLHIKGGMGNLVFNAGPANQTPALQTRNLERGTVLRSSQSSKLKAQCSPAFTNHKPPVFTIPKSLFPFPLFSGFRSFSIDKTGVFLYYYFMLQDRKFLR